jgi:hypothetical protein
MLQILKNVANSDVLEGQKRIKIAFTKTVRTDYIVEMFACYNVMSAITLMKELNWK